MLPIHIGYPVFNRFEAPLDLVNQIQHIVILPLLKKAFRLLFLFVLRRALLCPDPLYPYIILTHFLQAAFDIHFIDVKIIACFQDVVFSLYHLFHVALQMLLQKLPIGLFCQQAVKEFIHIMEHILKRLIQLPGIDQGGL